MALILRLDNLTPAAVNGDSKPPSLLSQPVNYLPAENQKRDEPLVRSICQVLETAGRSLWCDEIQDGLASRGTFLLRGRIYRVLQAYPTIFQQAESGRYELNPDRPPQWKMAREGMSVIEAITEVMKEWGTDRQISLVQLAARVRMRMPPDRDRAKLKNAVSVELRRHPELFRNVSRGVYVLIAAE